MRSVVRFGVVLSLGVFAIVGCGGKPAPESLVKTHVDILNAYAAEFELQASDPAASAASNGRLAKIESDLKASQDAIEKLTPIEYQTGLMKHHADLKRANLRLRLAKDLKNRIKQ